MPLRAILLLIKIYWIFSIRTVHRKLVRNGVRDVDTVRINVKIMVLKRRACNMGLNKVQSVAGNFVDCGPVHSLKQILGKYPEKKEKKKNKFIVFKKS